LQDLNLQPSSGCAGWKVEPDYFRAATIKISIESLVAGQDLNLRPSSGCAGWKVEPDYFRAATIKISIESLVAGAGFEPATFGL
jgi:hypothetical protein